MQEVQPLFSLLYPKHIVDNKKMILTAIPKYAIVSDTGKILSNSDIRPSQLEFELEIENS
ncbi:hypothetical protein ACWGOQ_0023045 [Aquimarina sp. M1]